MQMKCLKFHLAPFDTVRQFLQVLSKYDKRTKFILNIVVSVNLKSF